MYYRLLARFSNVVGRLSDRLLRRRVVVPAVVLCILALPLQRVVPWIGYIGVVVVLGLLMLWMADRWTQSTDSSGEGLP